MIRLLPLIALALLTACGPLPLPQAEKVCIEDARLAQRPRGSVGLGYGSGGFGAVGDVTITSDFLFGRDPDAVYADCVRNRSGQSPSRPFSSLPQSRM